MFTFQCIFPTQSPRYLMHVKNTSPSHTDSLFCLNNRDLIMNQVQRPPSDSNRRRSKIHTTLRKPALIQRRWRNLCLLAVCLFFSSDFLTWTWRPKLHRALNLQGLLGVLLKAAGKARAKLRRFHRSASTCLRG